MAGEITITGGDRPCKVTQSGGVDKCRALAYSTVGEDQVTLPAADNSPLFAGVMLHKTAQGEKGTRRLMGVADVKLGGNVTVGQLGYAKTDGTFVGISAASTPAGYWACVQFLRAGAAGQEVPAEVLCPPRYVEL